MIVISAIISVVLNAHTSLHNRPCKIPTKLLEGYKFATAEHVKKGENEHSCVLSNSSVI